MLQWVLYVFWSQSMLIEAKYVYHQYQLSFTTCFAILYCNVSILDFLLLIHDLEDISFFGYCSTYNQVNNNKNHNSDVITILLSNNMHCSDILNASCNMFWNGKCVKLWLDNCRLANQKITNHTKDIMVSKLHRNIHLTLVVR